MSASVFKNLEDHCHRKRDVIGYWGTRYHNKATPWHINGVNKHLQKYVHLFGKSVVTGRRKRVLVPLCGKTKDMQFLMSLGFEVFGAEGVDDAIQEFFTENDIQAEYDDEDLIYYTSDKSLTIYNGDFFKFPAEKWGPFDCVWDRGSFIAIDYDMRLVYKQIMQRSLGCNPCTYLLQTVNYDNESFHGPPRNVTETDMGMYFGDWTNYSVLEKSLIEPNSPMRKVSGDMGDKAFEILYHISNF